MYQFQQSGIDNVWLENGYHENGASIEVQGINNLNYTIATHLTCLKTKLSPSQFKYLRKQIEATQEVIANTMGICESTVRNWEHGRSEISPIADRMIRLMYRSCVADKTELVELVNGLINCDSEKQKIICCYSSRWQIV